MSVTGRRHSAGTREGGRFKASPAPDLAGDAMTLERTPGAILDDIRNLGLVVEWEHPSVDVCSTNPVVPRCGPLAGLELKVTVWRCGIAAWHCWHAKVTIPGLVIIEVWPGGGSGPHDSWRDWRAARDDATALLHGRTGGMQWSEARQQAGDWGPRRPMDELAGWLRAIDGGTGR